MNKNGIKEKEKSNEITTTLFFFFIFFIVKTKIIFIYSIYK